MVRETDRQTDRQTYTLTAILCTHNEEVTNKYNVYGAVIMARPL